MGRCLQLAFPGKKLAAHLHLPPWIIAEVRRPCPGILMVRAPLEAAFSNSVSFGEPIAHCLDYYIDFHRVLWRYREDLFVATFEQVIPDPNPVIERFSARFNLSSEKVLLDPGKTAQLFRVMDNMPAWTLADGSVDEMRVARPSEPRRKATDELRQEWRNSAVIQRKLETAERLYQKFRTLAERFEESGRPDRLSA